MSGIRDHVIFEIEVDADFEVPINGCSANGTYWEHRVRTYRVGAPKNMPFVAQAYVDGRLKFSKMRNLKISEPRALEIDAFFEEHIY